MLPSARWMPLQHTPRRAGRTRLFRRRSSPISGLCHGQPAFALLPFNHFVIPLSIGYKKPKRIYYKTRPKFSLSNSIWPTWSAHAKWAMSCACTSTDGGGECGGGGGEGGQRKNPKTRLRNSTYEETKRAALEASTRTPGGPPQCYRCPAVGKCNPRGGEVLCWECLGKQMTRNFRNQMTRARASAPSERLLVAFSGGVRSIALAHLFQRSVGDLRGRQFYVHLAFVDDTGIFQEHGLTAAEARKLVSQVESVGRGFGFEFTTLQMSDCSKDNLAAGLAKIAAQKNSDGNARTVTEWEDDRTRLRMDVLLSFAHQNGFTRVVLADSATTVAARVVAHATKGVHLNSSDLSHSENLEGFGTLKSLLRPLNDIIDEELFLLLRSTGAMPVASPLGVANNSDVWQRSSLNFHCRRLVAILQQDKKGSVHTILRTIFKLEESKSKSSPAPPARTPPPLLSALPSAASKAATAALSAAAAAENTAEAVGGTVVGNDFMQALARAAAVAAAAAAERERGCGDGAQGSPLQTGAAAQVQDGGGAKEEGTAQSGADDGRENREASASTGACVHECGGGASSAGGSGGVGQSTVAKKRGASMCGVCGAARAAVKRSKNGAKVCKDCFYHAFEEEIHETIITEKMFSRGEKVCVAASGGKDSTVLAEVMTTLNARHDYGLELHLLSVDEGIAGYRDDSLETVKRNQVP